MKTDSTSWSQLNAEIEDYKKRGKQNLQKYQKKRFNLLYKKKHQKTQASLSSVQTPQNIGYSMNLIRQWKQREAQQTQRIINKMSFLKVQRDRKIQSSERARNQLNRVLSIRSTSSQQKSLCQSQIRQFKINNYERKKQLNQRIKSQKAKIDLQRKKILSKNSYKAKQVRSQSIENEYCIKKQKQLQINLKQKNVEKGQKQFQNIILKKQQRQKSIIQTGKKNHLSYIQQQYVKLQKNKKLNQQIFKKLKNQSKRIIEQTQKAQRDLQNFERILMRNKKQNKRQESSRNQSINDKSTPVTNAASQENSLEKQKKKINNFFHLTN